MSEITKEVSKENIDGVKVNSVDNSSQQDFFGRMRKNPWIVSTVVLAVLLSLVLFFNLGTGGISGSVVNENTASQNLIDFIAKQGMQASIVSAEKDGLFYKVVVDVSGQEVPVFVSLDGKYLVSNPIPLTELDGADNTVNPANSATADATANVPKSDKPLVELFVMSHCPYGTQIEKGILPVVKALGDKIDFKLKFVNYAMHGEVEVKEQLNQYCIQQKYPGKYLDYLVAFLEKGDGKDSMAKLGITEASLASCIKETDAAFSITENLQNKDKWLNGRFPAFNIFDADNKKYGVAGSPTLVINGVSANSGRDSASLLKAICGAFNTAPGECSTELSSAQPSPGFGVATTSGTTGATAAANCVV